MQTPLTAAFRFVLLAAACMTMVGCAAVDLFPHERRAQLASTKGTITLPEIQAQVRRQIDPEGRYTAGTVLVVTGTDIWTSTLLRWLTPLDEDRQQFRAELNLAHQGIAFTFLNGGNKGHIIGFDGRSYSSEGGRIVYKKRTSVALYLRPLQNYLEWHQTLIQHPSLEFAGFETIDGTDHWVLYATEGNTQHLAGFDQFLVYVNAQTKQVAFVEFTLRELMKSYKGVVHYRDYRPVQGLRMPHWVGIADAIVNPDFDHYVEIDQIIFPSS